MIQALPAFLAALVVMVFSIRAGDSFALSVVAGVAWTIAGGLIGAAFHFRPAAKKSNSVWGAIGVAFLLTASVVVTRWPVRLGPVVFRAQFQVLADRVAAGESFSAPQRIGPFTIQRGEVERGFVCLWTDLDPAGRSGYVRGLSGDGLPFNAWSVVPAGAEWQFLVED